MNEKPEGQADREEDVHFNIAVVFDAGDGGLIRGLRKGGQFSRFDPVVRQFNQSGELFHIEGHCQSSCTLFLAIRNVCIEPDAELLFHGGHDRERNVTASATNHLLSA